MPRSLLLMQLLAFSACANGPRVTVYVADPPNNQFESYNEQTGAKTIVPWSQGNKFICLSPTDAQTLLNYCGSAMHQTAAPTP